MKVITVFPLIRHICKIVLCISCLFIGSLSDVMAQVPHLLLTTELSSPNNTSDDGGKTIHGLVADKVHEIMRRSKVSYTMELMTWNRAFELARNEAGTCVFSTVRLPERESWFKWVGPLEEGEWMLFGTPDKRGKIDKLEQVKNAWIGGYLGDAIARSLINEGYHVILSTNNDITLKNLLTDHVDYMAASRRGGAALIERNKLQGQVVPLLPIRKVSYYLACNPATDDALIEKLRVSMKEMMADGTAAKINAKY